MTSGAAPFSIVFALCVLRKRLSVLSGTDGRGNDPVDFREPGLGSEPFEDEGAI